MSGCFDGRIIVEQNLLKSEFSNKLARAGVSVNQIKASGRMHILADGSVDPVTARMLKQFRNPNCPNFRVIHL